MTDRGAAPSTLETIKAASGGLRGSLGSELRTDATHFTDAGRQVLKFHGVYEQDDRDDRRTRKDAGDEPSYSFMVRAKIPAGVLSGAQYLAFDALATAHAGGALRVTTRQDIQLHGVVKRDLKRTIQLVNDALVTTLGACGDVVRNVVTCPAPLPGPARDEALRMARGLSDRLLPRTRAYHEIWLDGESVAGGAPSPEPDPLYGARYLPRKFKIGISFPDDNCCDVHSNDLGLLALVDDDHIIGYEVLVGGGLGATHGKKDTFPRLATPLAFAEPGDIAAIAEAVVGVHREFGDRTNRRHARLKYVVEENGIAWFRDEVERRLERPLAPFPPPPGGTPVTAIHDHLGWHEQGDGRWFLGVFVENGRVRDDERSALRTALRRIVTDAHAGVRLTSQQNLLLTGIAESDRSLVDRVLDAHGVIPVERLAPVRRWAMACPALPTCGLALAEAERAMPGVLTELERELARLELSDAQLTVRMTGCPNGCARPYTADLAFVGRSADRYTIFVGGSMLGTRLAKPFADLVRRDDLVATVRPLLERYRGERRPGERFGDYCERIGVAPALTT